MRILHLHTRYRQPGGEDRVVDAERELLARAGYEIVACDVENAPDLRAGVQFAASSWNFASGRRVRDLLDREQPDVAHIHNTWFAGSPSVIGAIGRAGVPSIMTLHNYRLTCIAATLSRDGRPCDLCVHGSGWNGVRHRCYRDDLASSAIALAGTNSTRATALRHVSTFAVLTEFAREVYVEAGFDPERLIVLPNFTEDPGPRNLPAEKSETVLFIGRLSPEKGIDRFLDAWEKGGTGLRLLVIGEGPLGAVLRRRHPDISFTGHLQPDEVRQLLLEARCLALPSTWYEGQSLVLLEAMAAGVPIMASDWPPIAETLSSSAAMLIDAHDVDAWVSAIRRVAADDGLISSASRASRDRWAGRHSPRAGLERLRDAYKSIVERAHG